MDSLRKKHNFQIAPYQRLYYKFDILVQKYCRLPNLKTTSTEYNAAVAIYRLLMGWATKP